MALAWQVANTCCCCTDLACHGDRGKAPVVLPRGAFLESHNSLEFSPDYPAPLPGAAHAGKPTLLLSLFVAADKRIQQGRYYL